VSSRLRKVSARQWLTTEREKKSFRYDAMGRLIREECKLTGIVLVYGYDRHNNISEVREYRNGVLYNIQTYNNTMDRVMSISNSNRAAGANMTFSYDEAGNPVQHGLWHMTWTRGRLLQRKESLAGNWTECRIWEFGYDENGIRYRKTERRLSESIVNVTTFFTEGTQIIAEYSQRYGLIEYFYDLEGIRGMRRGGRDYLFVRCVLGNIVEVLRVYSNSSFSLVARYRYDAWGNTTVLFCIDNISHINPFRYRGKYTDRATGFIYMNTRYYNPAVRRFINADNYMLVPLLAQSMELNMYAYALQNPIMYQDPSGQIAISTIVVLTILGIGLAGGGAVGAYRGYHHHDARGWELVGWTVMGACFGLALGGLVVATGGVALKALAPVLKKGITTAVKKKIISGKTSRTLGKALTTKVLKKAQARGTLAFFVGGTLGSIPAAAIFGINIQFNMESASIGIAQPVNNVNSHTNNEHFGTQNNFPLFHWLA